MNIFKGIIIPNQFLINHLNSYRWTWLKEIISTYLIISSNSKYNSRFIIIQGNIINLLFSFISRISRTRKTNNNNIQIKRQLINLAY